MKKSLIVLGILAGITGAAHAENKTILSGSVGYSLGFSGVNDRSESIGDNVKDFGKSVKDNVWDLKNTQAKFSIKGNEDINSDLSAIYNLEFDVKEKTTKLTEREQALGIKPQKSYFETKKAYLGLKGGFGEITFGKQSAAYGGAVDFNDTFNDLGAFESSKIANFNKGIKYKTPGTLAGFELTTTIELDKDNKASKGVDLWEVAAIYNANGIKAGVGYQKSLKDESDKGTDEVIGTSVGYKNDAFQAGVGYVHRASVGNYYNLGGEVYSGQNTFRAGLSYDDEKGKANDKWTGALGYQYNFSERTYSWVEGQYDYKKETKKDGYNVVVGIRHDF